MFQGSPQINRNVRGGLSVLQVDVVLEVYEMTEERQRFHETVRTVKDAGESLEREKRKRGVV